MPEISLYPVIHLWRLSLNPARLAAIAQFHGIPASDEDHGYTVHALLCGLFGKHRVPKPWHFDPVRGLLWAYAGNPLSETAADFADPLYHSAVQWEQSASKAMPVLTARARLVFDLRACPIVRRGRGADNKASEYDYMVWVARRDGVALTQIDASLSYSQWLRERAWPSTCGATIDACRVVGWQKPPSPGSNAYRGHGDGHVRLPDVRFTGQLTVSDPSSFAALLARGIGRHRSFGYGMLLLRASENSE